jgi:hypothetical protein
MIAEAAIFDGRRFLLRHLVVSTVVVRPSQFVSQPGFITDKARTNVYDHRKGPGPMYEVRRVGSLLFVVTGFVYLLILENAHPRASVCC